jgi:oxygen-independent coproporphyrinogen-3 oxidase
MPPLSLYIHIPWCLRKCPYCDFNSYQSGGVLPEEEYIVALLADLEQELPKVGGRQIDSIFIGGGTPSLFSPEAISHLLTGVRARLTLSADAEITLEANPGTVDRRRYQGFRAAGINRLSLGIQSFDEAALRRLARIHNRQEAIAAIEAAYQAGFDNLNLDLMFGLPTQTLQAAVEDLRIAVSFQPAHLSWYQLTIEPHTGFYNTPPRGLPEEDLLWDMQTAGQAYLATQGYHQYEISAYAKIGRRCKHNLNYWKFGDYLGIGAGAHGKISNATPGTISRWSKQLNPHTYLKTAPTAAVIENCTTLTVAEIGLEFMMNALRLAEGFTIQEFTTSTGLTIDAVASSLQQGDTQGWLVQEGDNIRATAKGMQFLNELLGLFVQ